MWRMRFALAEILLNVGIYSARDCHVRYFQRQDVETVT